MNQEKKLKKCEWDEQYLDLEMQLLSAASRREEPLKRSVAASMLIRKSIQDLKTQILQEGFTDISEEIHFFKYIKPRFYSLLLLESKLAQLECHKPIGDQAAHHAYYREELSIIDRFFKQHAYHYTYYLMDAAELDHLYFLRGKFLENPPVLDAPDEHPDFTTACDYLFSQFIALELFRDHLLFLLGSGEGTAVRYMQPPKKIKPITWTGEVIDAVELAYAIWLSDHVNGGEAELYDIVAWLSHSLHINLTRYTRLFTEIKARKILSKTKFLDLLKDGVQHYINDNIEWNPNKRKARRIK